MRNIIVSIITLALGSSAGCAATSPEIAGTQAALIFVSAADIEELAEDEMFPIVLNEGPAVYHLDGENERLDIDRISVLSRASETMALRDYLVSRDIILDEQHFYVRLASDASLLVDGGQEAQLGSTTQELKAVPIGGGGGGGGLGYQCNLLTCTCSGDIDCNDMFREDGPCKGDAYCDTTKDVAKCLCVRFSFGFGFGLPVYHEPALTSAGGDEVLAR